MQFSAYYHTQEIGEYLRQMVAAAGIGPLEHFTDFSGLGVENEADVVFLEYQDNNPHLDHWIARITEQPQCPEIFLLVPEASPQVIWKALKLGVRELFSPTILMKDFRQALARLELRRGLIQPQSEAASGSWLPLPESQWVSDLAA